MTSLTSGERVNEETRDVSGGPLWEGAGERGPLRIESNWHPRPDERKESRSVVSTFSETLRSTNLAHAS